MEFEFDQNKSEANLRKHGIDFTKAQALWEDSDRLLVPTRVQDEPRYMLVAKFDGKHWSAIFTPRGSKIRIISIRRSREKEIAAYES